MWEKGETETHTMQQGDDKKGDIQRVVFVYSNHNYYFYYSQKVGQFQNYLFCLNAWHMMQTHIRIRSAQLGSM